jgi:tRNA modification GTPase
MFSTTDTIVAIATPPGRGAIGVVRLSGPDASRIAGALVAGDAKALEPRRATLATIDTGILRDRVVITAFPAPASYTGDDVVEISAHGSDVVLRAILAAAIERGARLAAPGEFTLRAYLNGRMDLPQAEAVADLVDAVTPLQARAAFDQLNGTLSSAIAPIESDVFDLVARLEASVDFPDEGYHFIEPATTAAALDRVVARIDALLATARRGRLIREGVQVAIAGRPNAGKSSLFNALVGAHRAIVTPIPGTTRDLLTETVDLDGLRVTLVDTAGITETDEPIEREGVSRARQAASAADVVLLVCDASTPWLEPDSALPSTVLHVASKSDLPRACQRDDAVAVSAVTGVGLDVLTERIRQAAAGTTAGHGEALRDLPAVSNVRHVDLLARAREAIARASAAVVAAGGALSEEFVLADLQQARHHLEEITGARSSDDVLVHVFERFCVGK